MRILFVSVRPPLPRFGGAALRGYNFIRLLGARHEVYLVCCGSVREELELQASLGDICKGIQAVPAQEGPPPWQRAVDLAASALPDLARRFPAARLYDAVVAAGRRLGPDVVHVLGLEAAPAIFADKERALPHVKIVLDELNAEYLLQRRAFHVDRKEAGRLPGAAYSLVQSVKLRRYEQQMCARADAVIAVSNEDAVALQRLFPGARVGVVPNGVDTDRYRPAPREALQGVPPNVQVLLFTGTMDFRPNADAVTWFAGMILPSVRFVVSGAHLVIGGRDPAPSVQVLAGEAVTVTGSLPDDLPLFHAADVFVLPMRFGGGSRLKLLQALACGLPVVSTRLGASGVNAVHGDHLLLADTPAQFFDRTVRLLTDRGLAEPVGRRARELALEYDWRVLAPRLEAFYEQVITGQGTAWSASLLRS